MTGGASASGRGNELQRAATAARARRQAGGSVKRGASETSLKREAKAWNAGSVGEERAARKLDLLKPYGFTCLHDVLLAPGKKWNLDHLVVGPPGVFFIDAKNWRGHINVRGNTVYRSWYAGPKQGNQTVTMDDEVNKVRGMAAHASARFGERVTPVICLAGGKSRQFKGVQKAAGVYIISVDEVATWLRTLPMALAPELVAMNAHIAQRLFPSATPPKSEEEWVRRMRLGL